MPDDIIDVYVVERHVWQGGTIEAHSAELDDLATRKRTWERAAAFYLREPKIRAAYRYSELTVKKDGSVGELRDDLRKLGKKWDGIGDLMENEAKLQSQLLDLLESIQSIYRTRYLQAFDEVTGKCEAVRTEIDNLPDTNQFRTVAELVKIEALASVNMATLNEEVAEKKVELFQSSLDRNGVERALKERPQPEGCALHVDDAANQIVIAKFALEQAKSTVWSALLNIASLLCQPALRRLLEQGKQEQFIADVLGAASDEKLAEILAECIPPDPANAKLLGEVPEADRGEGHPPA